MYRASWTTRNPRDRKAVHVTAQLRARAVRVGALLALVGGMLAVASSPALAADPQVQISVGTRDVQSGATVDVSYTVTNPNDAPAVFLVSINGNGFTCVSGDCSPQTPPVAGHATSNPFRATLKAPTVAAGQNQTLTVSVLARSAVGQNSVGSSNVTFTVHGADKPQAVRQVSGKVKDQDGKAVAGADVGMLDSQNHQFRTTSNDSGLFQFTSTDKDPIAPGALTVGANKAGFKTVTVNVQGQADKTVNVPLTLTATAASPSPSPSATDATTAPADDATQAATDAASPPPAAAPQNTANDSKGNSMLYIILGALLVAAGIGAIVLLVMRRRNKKDDDDPDGFGGGAVGGGPVPPSQGRYNGLPDATRVAAPVGAGVNDATRVRQPSISDAPTMMQPAVPAEDEFPDPYGAPAVPGYGQTTQYGGGAYGSGGRVPAQSGGYDSGPPTQFTEPDDGAYGAYAPQGGYGSGSSEPQRYDEPTGMYQPAVDEYGRGGGGYQTGSWAAPAGGIDSGNGYGPAAGGPGPDERGGYDQGYGGQGGYDQGYGGPGGYDQGYGQGGYDQGGYGPGGYDQGYGGQGGYDQAGYDQGGNDQRGGYGRGESYDRGGYDQGGPAGGTYGGGASGGQYGGSAGDDQGRYYGGNEQGGGRHGEQSQRPPEQSPRPGQRRNIDWLDD
jgi:hypothetical protein